MSTFKTTHSAPEGKSLWTIPLGVNVVAVRVDDKPALYSQPQPYEVLLETAPECGQRVEFEMYRPTVDDAARALAGLPAMYAIRPSDTEDLLEPPKAIFVSDAGTLSGVTTDGMPIKIAVTENQLVRGIAFRRINAKGTTAGGLVALAAAPL